MSIERDDANGLPRSARSDEAEALFHSVGSLMGGLLMRDYGMSEAAVEAVLQDVFRDYMASEEAADDPRARLAAGILARAASHLRLRGIEPDAADGRRMLNLIYTQAALATLHTRAREALMLLFHKQRSYEEIAAELGTSVGYAKRLVTRAMAQLRRWKP